MTLIKDQFRDRGLSHIVESQMRHWELKCASDDIQKQVRKHKHNIKFITISRELASGGEIIANFLGEMLNWHVYDKDVLDYMAKDLKVHKQILESVDEKTNHWIERFLSNLSRTTVIHQETYFHHLSKVLMVIANHGEAIIVGRGAGLLLPAHEGLRIRIAAPLEMRCQTLENEQHISANDAVQKIKDADMNKHQFIKDYLGKDYTENKHYDMVFNMTKFSPLSIAKIIWRTLDQTK